MSYPKYTFLWASIFFGVLAKGQGVDSCSVVAQYQKISDTQGNFTASLDNSDQLGYSITSIGDFNNDGVSDIAFTAVNDDDGGTDRGALYLGFMNANGTIASYQKISSASGNFGTGLDDSDKFGIDMANIGDLNNDGVVDLAVTAAFDDDGGTDQGAVWILFLNSSGNVASKQKISETQGGFSGILDNDDFFIRVANIGDINNDGTNDLAVGATGDDDGGSNAGALWILCLNTDGTVQSSYKISDTSGNFSNVLNSDDQFGYSIALLGDLNSDGYTEIAVSANQDDDGIGSDHGAIYILSISDTGTVVNHVKYSALTTNLPIGSGDLFGSSLYCDGDLNGDGLVDLLVGSVFNDNGSSNAGAAYLLSLDNALNLVSWQEFSMTSGNLGFSLEADDAFGSEVFAWEDADGNGYRDLIIGAKYDDDGGSNRGALYVLFMQDTCCSFPLAVDQEDTTITVGSTLTFTDGASAAVSYTWLYEGDTISTSSSASHTFYHTGAREIVVVASDSSCSITDTIYVQVELQNDCITAVNHQKISATSGGFNSTLAPGNELGYGIAPLGDFNGDGFPDVAVGSHVNGGKGAVYLLMLNNNGTVISNQKITESTGSFGGTLSPNGRFGVNITNMGDLDGNGAVDLAIGSFLDDDGGIDRGSVWILFLDLAGQVLDEQKISDTQGGFGGILQNEDAFGRATANIGDINGDGVTDLAVGAIGDDDGGTDRGAVWILQMNSDGTVNSQSKISASSGNFTGMLTNGAHMGYSVQDLGDINGDGNREIAVGAPFEDSETGAVFILSIDATGAVVSHITIDNAIPGLGIGTGDRFGISLSAGDITGNGTVELIVGAPMVDVATSTNRGVFYIIELNSSFGINSISKVPSSSNILNSSLDANDLFGSGVGVIGDINGDGSLDIAASAVRDDDGGSNTGALYITFMQDACCSFPLAVDQGDTTITVGSTLTFTDGASAAVSYTWLYEGDTISTSSSASHTFYHTGAREIVVIASDGPCTMTDTISVQVELDVACIALDSFQKITNNYLTGLGADDQLGYGIASLGDLNGDGVPDLAVGAQKDDDGGTDRGAVYILFMQSDGSVASYQKISSTSGNFGTGLDDNDRFGMGIANIGDLNSDGVTDIAVSAIWDDDGGIDRGAVYVLFLDSSGNVQSKQKISQTQGNFTESLSDGDRFGRSLANIGDINGDGVSDLAVGAYYDDDGGLETGAVWILRMNSNGTVSASSKISATQGGTTLQLEAGGFFGSSMAALNDLDGDGTFEIAVGAEHANSLSGKLYLISLSPTGSVDHFFEYDASELGFPPGSAFTSSLSSSDLNSNGMMDLVVGAQLYPNNLNQAVGGYFILELNPGAGLSSVSSISSSSGYSLGYDDRFGAGVTILGDLNGDGVEEIAATAVYDDDAGANAGALYINFMQDTCCSVAPDFVFDQSTICIGDTAIATDNSINATSFEWYLNDSLVGTGPTASFSFGTAGTHEVKLISGDGTCSREVVKTLTVAPSPNADAGSSAFVCEGDSVQLNASGGVSYAWDNASTLSDTAVANPYAFPTAITIYTVTVTDQNGCTDSDNLAVIVNQKPTVTVSGDSFICAGMPSQLAATGAVTYGWQPNLQISSPSAPNPVVSPLQTTTYVVTGTDANGCSDTAAYTVIIDTSLEASIPSIADVNCFGGNDGGALALAQGGTSPYTYLWPGGESTDSIGGKQAGTYTVTITDSEGCLDSAQAVVSQPDSLMIDFTIQPVSCNGASDGSATALPTGGTSPYSYAWSGGGASATLGGLTSGIHGVTVTDDHGCATSDVVSVTEPAALVASVSINNHVLCHGGNDGSATASATGGTSPYQYAWSSGATGATANNLQVGKSYVTVTDFNGCTYTDSITLAQPTVLTVSALVNSNVSCYNGTDAVATANGSGGILPYQYTWSSGAIGATANGLQAILQQVTVTDANGCTATTSVTPTQPTELIITIDSSKNVLCNGFYDGEVLTSGSGGIAPYAFLWSTGQAADDIDSLTSGTYIVTLSDANNCEATASVTVIELDPVLPVITTGPTSCFGGNDGSASVAVSGGGNVYDYLWSTGSGGTSVSSLASDTVSITITDENNCYGIDSALVNQPDSIEFAFSVTNASCDGASDGAATASVSGGTSPYWYNWSNGAVAPAISGADSGMYVLSVVDAHGCTNMDSILVSDPAPLTVATFQNIPVSCAGLADGVGHAIAFGGTAPYSFLWQGSVASDTVEGLTGGNYSVTVTDSLGCTATGLLAIDEPSPLSASIDSVSHILCFDDDNGVAFASSSGGTSPYTFAWSNGDADDTATNLDGGAYTVTVTDSNGCTATESTSIQEPAQPLAVTLSIADANCFGGANGSITAVASGGTGPYAYNWSNGSNQQFNPSLQAGSYVLTVTDANGCSLDTGVAVSGPALPGTALVAAQDVLCNGGSTGSASVSFNGSGIAPYQYNWNTGATAPAISGLVAGVYEVSITDSIGCLQTAEFTVNEPSPVQVSVPFSQDVLCFGLADGLAVATGTGGTLPYTFTWTGGVHNDSLINVPVGTYEVLLTDANGCTDTSETTISQPQTLDAEIAILSTVLCASEANGQAEVTATGGVAPYTPLWFDGQNTFVRGAIPEGDFYVTVTDNNGCTTMDTAYMSEPDTLEIQFAGITPSSCSNTADGSAEVMVSGGIAGYNYLWSTGETASTINGLAPSDYSVSVTDANGCMDIETVTIGFEFSAPTVNLGPDMEGCSIDGKILSAGGGFANYLWSTGDSTAFITVNQTDTYSLVATDANGCSNSDDIYVFLSNGPQPMLGNDTIICTNLDDWEPLTLNAGMGTSFTWSTGAASPVITVDEDGLYSVTVTDSIGCKGTGDIFVVFDDCDNINQVQEVNEDKAIVIYPNPTRAAVFLKAGMALNGNVTVRNLQGQIVVQETVSLKAGEAFQVDLSRMARGTYTISIQTGQVLHHERIVVQ